MRGAKAHVENKLVDAKLRVVPELVDEMGGGTDEQGIFYVGKRTARLIRNDCAVDDFTVA